MTYKDEAGEWTLPEGFVVPDDFAYFTGPLEAPNGWVNKEQCLSIITASPAAT